MSAPSREHRHPTLWAISDLHIGHTGNKPVTESLYPATPDDWLIVAGDVAERTDEIRWSLDLLRKRFAKVIWVPGNHELWTTTKDPMQIFGRARYDYLVNMCDEMGIVTPEHPFPVWTEEGGPATIVPMFLLYDYTFLPEGTATKAEGLAVARERNVVGTDEFLLSAEPYATRDAWCRDRVKQTREKLEDLDWLTPSILVNHFPLVREPCDAMFYPEFSLWCGTTATKDWHTRYNAICSVLRPSAHPAHHVVRRRALRGGLGRLPARVAAPQALSLVASDSARPEVCAGLPQRFRRPLRDHVRNADERGEDAGAHPRPAAAMTSLLRGVVSEPVAAVELYEDPPELAPLPEEEPLIARSVAKRRNEFVTVRYCARQALGELGLPPVPILKGDKGEPCWPDGVVGSLTHCEGFRGAVVARRIDVRTVGIDAEPHDVLPKGVLDAISLPGERAELGALPAGLHWDRILFCAKEATYKAWFPLTHRWLGFEDAHITFTVDGSGDTGTFESRILIDPAAESGAPLSALSGRWTVRAGLALTAIVL